MTSVFSVKSTSLTICLVVAVTLLSLLHLPFIERLELQVYDLLFRIRGPVEPSSPVILAVIDEKSLAMEGRWPWPRSTLAELVDRLSDDNAKVIGFDMAFIEPDRQIQNDLALAKSIEQASSAVVLGYFFRMHPADSKDVIEPQVIEQRLKRLDASKYPFVMYGQDQGIDAIPFPKAYAPLGNINLLTDVSASSGHLMLDADLDHTIRWMPLIIQGGEELFPPLALWCAWYYLGNPAVLVKAESYGVEGVQMGQRFIPTDDTGRLLINYLGPPQTFPHVSISDILSGSLPPGTFTDKIVLVGTTAVGAHDLLSAPLSPYYPALEIHATVIENLLTQNFLIRPSWLGAYDLFAILLLGGLLGVMLPRVSLLSGLWLAMGLCLAYSFVVGALFVYAGLWITTVYPLMILVVNYIGLSFNRMARESRQAFRDLQDELEERQRTEVLLRQREAQYRALVEGSLQGISILKPDGTRVFANSALARIWGYDTPDDLIGRSLWENIAPHERSRLEASLDGLLKGEFSATPRTYQTVKQDGALIWTERLASPMALEGETVVLEAYIDITERQRLETQLQQAQKMQAVGTLAGGIAHDFNNLLTSILGFAELAHQLVGPDLPAGHYMEEVLTAGTRAKEIVQQMLTFSRQTHSLRAPIQLQPLIEEVFRLLSASLPSSIILRPILDPDAGCVLADATQIHQVLLNLCINASHAMRDSGGVLEVTLDSVDMTSDDPLVPLVLQAGPYIRLKVRDTGFGMPPEVMERIFEPFFTTKDIGEGTGLGLAVAHGIVMQHEGSITVESAPGQGATFTIHLPCIGPSATTG